jgi:hypothetical protein
MPETIRVRAVGDARLPVPGSASARYVGRDKKGAPIAEGVDVPADSYHRRAIARGDLEEVTS